MPADPLTLAGPVLLAAALAVALTYRLRQASRIAAAACGVVALVPLGGLSFGTFFLGAFGPVSAATLLLLGTFVGAAVLGIRERAWPSNALLWCLLVTGLAFYPLTFGVTSFDPYEFGYRGLAVPALMLVFVLAGWLARATDVACWIGLAASLYLAGAYDSNNLWDYLIFPADPLLAAGVLALRLRRRRGCGQDPRGVANLENSSTTRS